LLGGGGIKGVLNAYTKHNCMTTSVMEIVSNEVEVSLKDIIVSEGLDPNDERILSLAHKLSRREPNNLELPNINCENESVLERYAIFEDLVYDDELHAWEVKEVTVDTRDFSINDINVIHVNDRAKRLFGLSHGPLSKDAFYDLLKIMFDDSDELIRRSVARLFSVGRIIQKYSLAYQGKIRQYSSVIRLIRVGAKTFLVRVTTDISDVSNKEKIINDQIHKLQDRKKELEKYIESNLQLENFAYIASHDLKAPLRTVLSFSQLIKRSSYDALPDRDKKFLDIVIKSSSNMMLLIEDLLTFSRVNSIKVQYAPLQLSGFFETILIDLTSECEKKGAEIQWNIEDRVIHADKTKLLQLFENLIRNAIKFTETEIKPVVRISMEETEDLYKFSVKDNGIGISEKHLKKIFGIFEKLHSKDVYEGTGLGLSICSKIVEQHGGNIWVESEEGVGSTFNFTLSKNL